MDRKEYIGIALDIILDDETELLRVWVPELSPFTEHDPTEEEIVEAVVENEAPGGAKAASLVSVSYIECQFYGNTNVTRPNIHTGEHVRVYEYADNKKFYWDTIGIDDNLRTRERVRIHISSKPSQLDPLIYDSMYFVDLDSRVGQKKIHVHTSQFDGEVVGYDLIINIEESTFQLFDTEGNYFLLESLEKHWRLENGNKDYIDILPNSIKAQIAHGDYWHIEPDVIMSQIKSGDFSLITPNKISHWTNGGGYISIQPERIYSKLPTGDFVSIKASEILSQIMTGEYVKIIPGLIELNAPLTQCTGALDVAATIHAGGNIISDALVIDMGAVLASHTHPITDVPVTTVAGPGTANGVTGSPS